MVGHLVSRRRRSSEEDTRCRKKSREMHGEGRRSHRRTTPTSTIGSGARCRICSPLSRRLDESIRATIPGLHYAVKWKRPYYGLPELGWIIELAAYDVSVNVVFLGGADFDSPPPLGTTDRTRYIKVTTLEEAQRPELQSGSRRRAARRVGPEGDRAGLTVPSSGSNDANGRLGPSHFPRHIFDATARFSSTSSAGSRSQQACSSRWRPPALHSSQRGSGRSLPTS